MSIRRINAIHIPWVIAVSEVTAPAVFAFVSLGIAIVYFNRRRRQ